MEETTQGQAPADEKARLLEVLLDGCTEMVQVSALDSMALLYANRRAREFAGRGEAPRTGMHCYDFLMGLNEPCPTCPIRKLHGKTCVESRVESGGRVFAVKAKSIDWNGTKAFVEYAADITQDRRTQEDAENRRQQYQTRIQEQTSILNVLARDFLNVYLVDAERNAMRILKLDGYLTSGLDRAGGRTYPYYETCCQYITERVHPDDQEMMRAAMQPQKVMAELAQRGEYVSSYRVVIDGKIHYYQFKYLWVGADKQIIAGFQNIDEIIRAEKERQEVLTAALDAAERSNRAKTTFLSSMSHDLRTPLNAIIGLSDLASQHAGDEKLVRGYLEKVKSSSAQLLSLLNAVLDMSHIESGKVKVEEAPVRLGQLFEQLLTILQPGAAEKGQELRFETQTLRHNTVMADALKLQQILMNLLSNAVKFTPEGGHILLRAEEGRRAAAGYARFRFAVQDDGIGMSREFQQELFEPFTREQSTTISGIPGTGLGLCIAKNLTDLMGGTIAVKSRQGKGTEFTLSLQLRLAPGQTKMRETAAAEESAGEARTKRILLVEDNPLNREIEAELLRNAGFPVETAENGCAAVQMLETADAGTYDLVLMDIQMPEMDGYEATRRIRAMSDPARAGIPIYAMTANAFHKDQLRALDAGMDGYLAKPIDIKKLVETIEHA